MYVKRFFSAYLRHHTLSDTLLKNIPSHISSWTECQSKTLSVFPGKNVLLQSYTGSGKTLAYLLPTIQGLLRKGNSGEIGLVIVPTRELASQVGEVAASLVKNLEVQSTHICGGNRKLNENHRLIISTPGAIISNLPFINPERIRYIVIDEVDRLLDFGFIRQLEAVLSYTTRRSISEPVSVLVASATFPRDVEIICDRLLGGSANYEKIQSQIVSPPGLEHELFEYDPIHFLPSLSYSLEESFSVAEKVQGLVLFPTTRALMFFYSRLKTGWHTRGLLDRISVHALHGRMLHEKRMRIAEKFRNPSEGSQILFSTDVAARGLDFPNLSLVCQVGMSGVDDPVSQFTHRAGRTARAGNEGRNILFLGRGIDANSKWLKNIEKKTSIVKHSNQMTGVSFNHEVNPYQRHMSTKCLESLLSWYVERRSMLGLNYCQEKDMHPVAREMEQKASLVKNVVNMVRSAGVPEPRISSKLAKKLRIDDIAGLVLDTHR